MRAFLKCEIKCFEGAQDIVYIFDSSYQPTDFVSSDLPDKYYEMVYRLTFAPIAENTLPSIQDQIIRLSEVTFFLPKHISVYVSSSLRTIVTIGTAFADESDVHFRSKNEARCDVINEILPALQTVSKSSFLLEEVYNLCCDISSDSMKELIGARKMIFKVLLEYEKSHAIHFGSLRDLIAFIEKKQNTSITMEYCEKLIAQLDSLITHKNNTFLVDNQTVNNLFMAMLSILVSFSGVRAVVAMAVEWMALPVGSDLIITWAFYGVCAIIFFIAKLIVRLKNR